LNDEENRRENKTRRQKAEGEKDTGKMNLLQMGAERSGMEVVLQVE